MKNFKIIVVYILYIASLYLLQKEEGTKYVVLPLILGHVVVFLILKEMKRRKSKNSENIILIDKKSPFKEEERMVEADTEQHATSISESFGY